MINYEMFKSSSSLWLWWCEKVRHDNSTICYSNDWMRKCVCVFLLSKI